MLGTLAGIAIHRFRQKWLSALVLGPVAMPDILIGVSLLLMFMLMNISLGMVSIILAHVSFSIGFVALAVQSRMAGMDDSLIEAARDLGATPLQSFRLITLPLLMPGIIAGMMMAFTLSIDDFVVTFFTAGVGSSTLPLEIYSMVKIAVTPEVNAVSTLLMLLTLILITALAFRRKRCEANPRIHTVKSLLRSLLFSLSVVAVPVSAADKTLHLFNWNDYIADETVARFESQCGCTVVQDYFSATEEMMASYWLAAATTTLSSRPRMRLKR